VGVICIVWESPIGSPAIGGISQQRTGLEELDGQQRMGSFKQQVLSGESVAYGDEEKHGGPTYNDDGGYDNGERARKSYGEVTEAGIARPMVAEVPEYWAGMRRDRSTRISRDSSYYGNPKLALLK